MRQHCERVREKGERERERRVRKERKKREKKDRNRNRKEGGYGSVLAPQYKHWKNHLKNI